MRKWKRPAALLLALLLLCGCGAGTATAPEETNEIPAVSAPEPAPRPETDSAESLPGAADSLETEEPSPETGAEEDLFALYTSQRPPRQPDVEETLTLMIYMVGSDLESSGASATNDLNEMLASGADLSRVNVLVYTGGAAKWHSDVPADANAMLLLTESGFVTLETRELSSMGDPANLTYLLDYGYGNFPADSWALILWDHGNGPVMGYGSDKNFGGDALTLPELRAALEASPFGGGNRLRFIGFDACLMASAELAITLSDHADLLISSQETEPGYGWNYSFLAGAGTTAAETLACDIVDAFLDYSRDYTASHTFGCGDVTLSVVDLKAASALETALNDLFTAAANDVSLHFSALAAGRVKTRSLGRASTGSEYDLVDLGSLMSVMAERYPAETACVMDILETMVLYSGSNAAETCGLSLYYPCYNKKYYQRSWQAGYEALDLLPAYKEYLQQYTAYWMGSDLSNYFKGKLTASESENGTYALRLTAGQEEVYASAGYYILQRYSESTYTTVYYSENVKNNNGLLEADFDGNVLYCCNDYGERFVPVTVAHGIVEGVASYSVTGYFSRDYYFMNDLTRCRIQLAVEEATGEVTIRAINEIIDDSELMTGKQQEADFTEYPVISFFYPSPRYLSRDEEGRIRPFFDWQTTDSLTGWMVSTLNGLDYRMLPLYDDGSEYYIMFEITDITGAAYCSELLPVTLAAEPEAEPPVFTEIAMDESGTAVLFENEEVRVWLTLSRNPETGRAVLNGFCSNESGHQVAMKLTECAVNGSIYAGDATIWAAAGTTQRTGCYDWNDACIYGGVDVPERLQFIAHVYDCENGRYLLYETPISMTVPEGFTPRQQWEPVFGAAAEQQVLGEALGCTVTLQAMGKPLTQFGSGMTLQLKTENKTAVDAVITVEAIRLNGVRNTIYKVIPVKAGCTAVCMTEMSLTEDLKMCGIEEISSAALWLIFETEAETVSGWYEIELSQSGTADRFEPDPGQLLYDDGNVRVWMLANRHSWSYYWYLAVEHSGTEALHVRADGTCFEPGDTRGYSTAFYPDCINIISTAFSGSAAPEAVELTVSWSEGYFGEGPAYTTDVLTIPYVDEEAGQ